MSRCGIGLRIVVLGLFGRTKALLRLLGDVYSFIFILENFYSVLGDDHSLVWGSDDTWSGGMIGMLETSTIICTCKTPVSGRCVAMYGHHLLG